MCSILQNCPWTRLSLLSSSLDPSHHNYLITSKGGDRYINYNYRVMHLCVALLLYSCLRMKNSTAAVDPHVNSLLWCFIVHIFRHRFAKVTLVMAIRCTAEILGSYLLLYLSLICFQLAGYHLSHHSLNDWTVMIASLKIQDLQMVRSYVWLHKVDQ